MCNLWGYDIPWKQNETFFGQIVKYNTRWVVQGFCQVHGIDFDQTYASVVKSNFYKVFLVLATQLGCSVDYMHFVTTFLNGSIDGEDIFVEQSLAYEVDINIMCSEQYTHRPICPTGHGVHRHGRCTLQIFDHTGEILVHPACMLIYRPANMHIGRPVHHTHCQLLYKNSSPTPGINYQIESTVDVITTSQINTLGAMYCLLHFILGSLNPSSFLTWMKVC